MLINGDGVREVIWGTPDPNNSSSINTYIVSFGADRKYKWSMQIPSTDAGLVNFAGDYNADFNKDGKVDLVGVDRGGNVIVRLWSGPATASDFATAYPSTLPTGINAGGEDIRAIDVNGDGRTDLVVTHADLTGQCPSGRATQAYRNLTTGAGSAITFDAATNPAFTICLGTAPSALGGLAYEKVDAVRDLNGDGLPDFWVRTPETDAAVTKYDRIMTGARDPSYHLVAKTFSSLFATALSSEEQNPQLFSLYTDINGDGLEDFVYASWKDVKAGTREWKLRLNTGNGFGPIISTGSTKGLEQCDHKTGEAYSNIKVFIPRYAKMIQPFDVDGDGRPELLFPVSFANRVCVFHAGTPALVAPPIELTGTWAGSTLARQPVTSGASRPSIDSDTYACPENPLDASIPTQSQIGATPVIRFDADGDGVLDSPAITSGVSPMYGSAEAAGYSDSSLYNMNALRLTQIGASSFVGVEVVLGATGVNRVVSSQTGLRSDDLFGDGLTDTVVGNGCGYTGVGTCGIVTNDPQSPQTLPNGDPILKKKVYLNENRGPGGNLNTDNLTPQSPDLMSMVTDGLGRQTLWWYYPLTSAAGRYPNQVPLYKSLGVGTAPYIDERHIYFSSSMIVVARIATSNGAGDYFSTRYGYEEAMYNTQGRGMQGFRRIIEEDETNLFRTSTTFSQKFPLTGMVEDVYSTAINRDITQGTPAGTDGWYRHEAYSWRCNRANRNDTAACAPPALGTPITVPYFLYLDTKESWSRDAGISKTSPLSRPPALAHSLSINADDASCGGSTTTTSGYDAFGNLTAEVSYTEDQGTITLARQCARTTRVFVAPTTSSGSWWVDQLDSESTTTSVSYGVSLPSGATAPNHTLAKKYVFNADRTLQSMTVQPNVANQQIVTSYGYPTPSYGLPNSMAVTASGDPNGTRTTQTTYSADGYFPASVTNPLLQVSSAVIRSRDGQPSSATDANGLKTAMTYDPFGRMIKTSFLAADNATRRMPDVQTAVSACASNCVTRYGLPMDAYVVTTVADGAPTTATHYDTLGRVIRTETALIDGSRSLVDTDYNWRGLVQFQSDPYRAGETRYGTRFGVYDLLGRPDSKSVDRGNGELLTTYYGYVGRTTNIVLLSSNSQWPWRSMSRTVDALGRYVSTTDAMSGVTRYWYDANGGVVVLQDAKGVNTLASYNDIGQRTSSVDPNQGTWNFTYDALGELLTQTDARTKVQNFSYDKLGRRVTRSTNASTDVVVAGALLQNAVVSDSWTWDAPNAKGQLLSVARAVNGAPQKTDTYSYDSYARRVQALTTLSANATGTGATENYTHSWRYDTVYGRVKQHTYPSNDALWLRYARYGQLSQESDLSGAVSYRTLGTTSADVNGRGEVLRETLGSFITASYAYVAQTGQMSQAKHMINGATYPLRQLDYTYDTFGDVLTQSVTQGSVLLNSETFTYDPLFRLTQASRSANGNTNYAYDAVGNFKYKSDYSASVDTAYAYQPNSNRIASVLTKNNVSVNFNYDLNGNLISNSAGFSAIYDQDNRPVSITRSGNTTIAYGADGERYRETGSDGTRVIIGDYEKWVSTGEQKAYLGDYAVITTGSAGKKVNYLLKDRLGSVDAVANSDGSLAESRGYDAFGAPRQGTWADSPTGINLATTEKGFTQHEHLNAVGLIHMNGRAYDYAVGRFLSVDPIIQFPTNSQSLNPYSYIMNNPFAGTDPTGFAEASVSDTHCDSTAGTHTCGSTTQFKLHDGQGGFVNARMDIGEHGERSFSQVGGYHNGSKGQSAEGAARDNSKGTISDSLEKEVDRIDVERAVETGKRITGAIGNVVNPCPNSTTAGGCAVETAATVAVGKVGSIELSTIKQQYLAFIGIAKRLGWTKQAAALEKDLAEELARKAGASTPRGLSRHGGVVSAIGNGKGGTIVSSVGTVEQNDFLTYIQSAQMRNERIDVISGAHGFPDGRISPDAKMYEFDLKTLGGIDGVTVHNLPDMSRGEVSALLNRDSGTTIAAFCDSAKCLEGFK